MLGVFTSSMTRIHKLVERATKGLKAQALVGGELWGDGASRGATRLGDLVGLEASGGLATLGPDNNLRPLPKEAG